MKLGGRNKKSVVFITPYRVGIPKIQDVGPKTVMAQQFGILSELGVKNPDPRNQFIKDLKKRDSAATKRERNHTIYRRK